MCCIVRISVSVQHALESEAYLFASCTSEGAARDAWLFVLLIGTRQTLFGY